MAENRVSAVVVHDIRRARNSVNGNPSFVLVTSVGEFKTQTDASLGYAIENYTNPRYPDTYVIGNPANPIVTLVTTKTGRVYAIEYKGTVLR